MSKRNSEQIKNTSNSINDNLLLSSEINDIRILTSDTDNSNYDNDEDDDETQIRTDETLLEVIKLLKEDEDLVASLGLHEMLDNENFRESIEEKYDSHVPLEFSTKDVKIINKKPSGLKSEALHLNENFLYKSNPKISLKSNQQYHLKNANDLQRKTYLSKLGHKNSNKTKPQEFIQDYKSDCESLSDAETFDKQDSSDNKNRHSRESSNNSLLEPTKTPQDFWPPPPTNLYWKPNLRQASSVPMLNIISSQRNANNLVENQSNYLNRMSLKEQININNNVLVHDFNSRPFSRNSMNNYHHYFHNKKDNEQFKSQDSNKTFTCLNGSDSETLETFV